MEKNILLLSLSPSAMLRPNYNIRRAVQKSIAELMARFCIQDTFSGNLLPSSDT